MPSPALPFVEAASTLAVIAASNEPLLFLKGDLEIIAASASFCRLFEIDAAHTRGRKLSEIGDGEWALPNLASVLKATAAASAEIDSYEIDLIRKGKETRRLCVKAHKLDDDEKAPVRLLLAVTDLTLVRSEARQKDELLREKAVLLQEVQHRVANSLQIIASLLLRSARKVQSEEARGHLKDAHQRVMSIAAVQKHLAMSAVGAVPLRAYLDELCESLAASMIHDPKQLAIRVTVDDSVVTANISVSMGLIITELVINALKHAFPEHRRGVIAINFHSQGPNWTLSVSDDGVGISLGADRPKPGLGTGIVEALAKQMRAVLHVTDAKPGATITLVHEEGAGEIPVAA